MDKEEKETWRKIIPIIIMWITCMFVICNLKFTVIIQKLDKIENNTKQIIEYLNKGDVEDVKD